MLEIFKMDKDMEKDYGNLLNNQMLKFMMASIKMIKKAGQGYINGQMGLIIKELLRKIKNMELVKQNIKMENQYISNGILVDLKEIFLKSK